MQALLSSVAGHPSPSPNAQTSLSVGIGSNCSSGYGNSGRVLVALPRKPLAAKLNGSHNSWFSTRQWFPAGKRLAYPRLRVVAIQQASEKSSVKWVLDPVGDGDTSHLDAPVPLPGAFELASDAVTVGRVAGRADIVIPVATVSGLHARLEKRDGQLYVTDLDSTNGTYIDDKKVRPGAVTPVFPGSYITFGDEHLAVFRFSKIEEGPNELEEQESQS